MVTREVGNLMIEDLTIKGDPAATSVAMISMNDASGLLENLIIKNCVIDG